MRLVFAGTPGFAARVLMALLDSPHEVAGVLTQPDKPRGRHRSVVVAGPVKVLADEKGLPVAQPEDLEDPGAVEWLTGLEPDALVVAAYGEILPRALLDVPRLGCINVHASLLPRWRGAAPAEWAVLSGDPWAGVSIMQMEAGLDTGPVWATQRLTIDPQESAGALIERLADIGGPLVVRTLSGIEAGDLTTPVPQDDSLATHAPKLTPERVALDWRLGARELAARVRAADPRPVARAETRLGPLKVYKARAGGAATGADVHPGVVLATDPELAVATGDGKLVLEEVRPAGGDRMAGAAWARGRGVTVGSSLALEEPADSQGGGAR